MSELIATTKMPFPETIDSSMLASFRSCPQKFFRTYIEHWKPKAESVHLVAGKAFASGLEAARRAFYERGEGTEDSVAAGVEALIREYGDFSCPDDSAKSLPRMLGALEFYFMNYPLGEDGMTPTKFADGRRGIEFSFAVPLPITHPVTGNPILFTGRSDLIADFAGGRYIEDDKTTSSLGASWSRQWELRSQFTAYCWAAAQYGIHVDGVVVRGVSILKTKYDTQQVVTYRPQWEQERWLAQTVKDIAAMSQMWQKSDFDYNLDNACTEYGGCSFLAICKHKDPTPWLPMQFEQRVWDPLAREEVSLEQYLANYKESTEGLCPSIITK